jgi:hypothetical protein
MNSSSIEDSPLRVVFPVHFTIVSGKGQWGGRRKICGTPQKLSEMRGFPLAFPAVILYNNFQPFLDKMEKLSL